MPPFPTHSVAFSMPSMVQSACSYRHSFKRFLCAVAHPDEDKTKDQGEIPAVSAVEMILWVEK